MIVFPAIDIRGGKCVRLVEGDFSQETIFDDDPVDAARRWADQGASWLHVVDLDGARSGLPAHTSVVSAIRSATGLQIQFGGGLRSVEAVARAFDAGADRVVLGSIVLESNGVVEAVAASWPGSVAAALDARNGFLAVSGWTEQTQVRVEDAAERLVSIGVQHLIATDIGRDGRLAGPDLEGLTRLVELVGTGVIASGGVSSLADVAAIQRTGVSGVITGRALYDGRLNLGEVIRLAGQAVAA